MSGAVNYDLMENVERIVDANVKKEIVDLDDFDEVHLTKLYNLALNMDREEAVVVTAALVEKYPYEVYRTLAQHAERGSK